MNLNDLRVSKFLKKEDVGNGVLVTISRLSKENIAMEGADPEYKVVVYFEELDKPLTLNSTNGQIIAHITGHEDDIERSWPGTKIVLYNDPNVVYKGKVTGGIRVRAPRIKTPAPAPIPVPAPVQQQVQDDDNMPF